MTPEQMRVEKAGLDRFDLDALEGAACEATDYVQARSRHGLHNTDVAILDTAIRIGVTTYLTRVSATA